MYSCCRAVQAAMPNGTVEFLPTEQPYPQIVDVGSSSLRVTVFERLVRGRELYQGLIMEDVVGVWCDERLRWVLDGVRIYVKQRNIDRTHAVSFQSEHSSEKPMSLLSLSGVQCPVVCEASAVAMWCINTSRFRCRTYLLHSFACRVCIAAYRIGRKEKNVRVWKSLVQY